MLRAVGSWLLREMAVPWTFTLSQQVWQAQLFACWLCLLELFGDSWGVSWTALSTISPSTVEASGQRVLTSERELAWKWCEGFRCLGSLLGVTAELEPCQYSMRGVVWCFGKGRGAVREGGAEECCKIRTRSRTGVGWCEIALVHQLCLSQIVSNQTAEIQFLWKWSYELEQSLSLQGGCILFWD